MPNDVWHFNDLTLDGSMESSFVSSKEEILGALYVPTQANYKILLSYTSLSTSFIRHS